MPSPGRLITLLAYAAIFGSAGRADAQQGATDPPEVDLSIVVAEEVTRRLNDPTIRLQVGDMMLAGDSTIAGDLTVLDGDLVIAGRVTGNLLVVNGRAVFAAGGSVGGTVLVVGGSLDNAVNARIDGEIITHTEPYTYERLADGFRHLSAGGSATVESANSGSSDFLITTGKSYNRVEGMPIAFGPRLETEGANPLRLQALAIYRTETGLSVDPQTMGYYVRADQYIDGRRGLRAGATLHSVVEPIEEWHVSDLETGLATFLFHRDYRDHYERVGWSLFTTWDPENSPFLLNVEGRWEKHGIREAGSPWSLFRNTDEWRPQPIVAEGRIGSMAAQGEYDSRSSEWNPASGWLVRAQIERAFHVELEYPDLVELDPLDMGAPVELPAVGRFVAGLVDVRSYNRVDADSRLNVRVVAGGSLTGDPLPPQRQHALGGEGSMPGYSLFSKDCGARSSRVTFAESSGLPDAPPYFGHYGCDGFALLQAEFRGKLSFRLRWDGGPWGVDGGGEDNAGLDLDWDMAPDWSVFVDVGRGWSHDGTRPDEDTDVSVGAGILLERLGIYFAAPVTSGSGINLFVRLGPRF